MEQPYIIGMDIGTGSIKTLSMDLKGQVLRSQRFPYSFGGVTELDPQILLKGFISSIKNMVDEMQSQPASICLSSMMHGSMAVDQRAAPLSPLILWSDTRGAVIAASLRGTEQGRRIYSSTGTPLHAMSPLCKIRWIKENEAEIFKKAFKFISIKEFTWYHLFGEYCIDHSIASATGLFNIHTKQWDGEALEFAGIKKDHLSTPVPVNYSKNSIDPDLARQMKIDPSTKFIIGSSDGCLANLGSLCLEPTTVAVTIGTSAAARVTTNKPFMDPLSMPFNYIFDEDHFICGGAINNGGNVVEWLVTKFLEPDIAKDGYENLFNEINSIPAGSEGLVFLPYLNGERAPVWNEESCGVYFGIRSIHDRRHFLRAGIEGVCFAIKQMIDLLEQVQGRKIKQLNLGGGVSRNKILAQLLADICSKEVWISGDEDSSCRGACYLGLRSVGVINDYASIKINFEGRVLPMDVNEKGYNHNFEIYRSLYPALKELMKIST